MKASILIVDGYNIIGDWEELKILKEKDLGSARQQLVSDLAQFLPWCWERIIVVFDGQKFAWEESEGLEVVFTESFETADTMIERLSGGLVLHYRVEVATSDFAEHRAASNLGAHVMSAAALKERLDADKEHFRASLKEYNKPKKMMLNDLLHEKMIASLEKFKSS